MSLQLLESPASNLDLNDCTLTTSLWDIRDWTNDSRIDYNI